MDSDDKIYVESSTIIQSLFWKLGVTPHVSLYYAKMFFTVVWKSNILAYVGVCHNLQQTSMTNLILQMFQQQH